MVSMLLDTETDEPLASAFSEGKRVVFCPAADTIEAVAEDLNRVRVSPLVGAERVPCKRGNESFGPMPVLRGFDQRFAEIASAVADLRAARRVDSAFPTSWSSH